MVSRATTQLIKKYYLELTDFFGVNIEQIREQWFNELIELRDKYSEFTKKEYIALFIYRKAMNEGVFPITMNKVMRSGIRKKHLLNASGGLNRLKILDKPYHFEVIVENLFISICDILEIPRIIIEKLCEFESKLIRPKYINELATWCIQLTDIYLEKTGFMEIPKNKFHELSGMSGTSYVQKSRELFLNQPKLTEEMQCLVETRLKSEQT